jgi:hypothetical protein
MLEVTTNTQKRLRPAGPLKSLVFELDFELEQAYFFELEQAYFFELEQAYFFLSCRLEQAYFQATLAELIRLVSH